MQGVWDEKGVDTYSVEKVDTGEFKTFRVRARANYPGAFAVLVDQEMAQVSGERWHVVVEYVSPIKPSLRGHVLKPKGYPACSGHSNLNL
jgi:hypothetical protein